MLNAKILGTSLVIGALAMAGCTDPKPVASTKAVEKKAVEKKAAEKEEEEHDHGPGPHGGTVIELGKYHGEFTVDHAKKEATVYILDGTIKKAVPIAAEKLLLSIKSPPFQVDLKPMPQEADPKGQSSRFVGTHENLGKEQEFEGTVSGQIGGKPYLGDFKEEAHKDHKHEKK